VAGLTASEGRQSVAAGFPVADTADSSWAVAYFPLQNIRKHLPVFRKVCKKR
jgi:hypothetical protein